MKRRTTIILATIVSVGLAGAATAYAKQKFNHGAKMERVVERISSKLELTADQELLLVALKDEVSDIGKQMHEQRGEMKSEMLKFLDAESFDQGRAIELINAKTQVINESAPELIYALGTFLDGLDSEQKESIKSFMEKHHEKGRHRH